jgi:hypothetical protein
MLVPRSARAFHLVPWSLPFFVVITTTPALPRAPQSAEAAGPLMISIFSISSGLRSANRVADCPPT